LLTPTQNQKLHHAAGKQDRRLMPPKKEARMHAKNIL
jgi:hypothetical protein